MSLRPELKTTTEHFRGHFFPRCENTECKTAVYAWRRFRRRNSGTRMGQNWYCGAACLESAARQSLCAAFHKAQSRKPVSHRLPLGLLLLSRGLITSSQLQQTLAAQAMAGDGRLGRWLEHFGFVTEQEVTAALSLQWACPVLPSAAALCCSESLLPVRLLESSLILPIRFVAATRTLYVAFSEDLDYTVLHAISEMLGCRTEASLVSHSAMGAALDNIRRESNQREVSFETPMGLAEIAHILGGYVSRLGGEEVRLVACGDYAWVRIFSRRRNPTDLLFRHLPARQCASVFAKAKPNRLQPAQVRVASLVGNKQSDPYEVIRKSALVPAVTVEAAR
jgi:Type II secretion system (T2SS), protein E, N-terminal domain